MVADAVQVEPVSSLQIREMQGDFGKMQGGAKHYPAKNDWVSIVLDGPSLLADSEACESNRTSALIGANCSAIPARVGTLSENSIPHLLKLAGVPSFDKAATRHNYAAAKQRPLPADHNALLADIEKSAKELTQRIERLRRYPVARHAFWRSKAFGPVHYDRVEAREVLPTLETIVRAAGMAKDPRQGRRREAGKQHMVDQAFAFFVRFSPQQPSGTPTGAFARFAGEFYSGAIGIDPDEQIGLDRQIRQALTRLSIVRARRKSGEKPKASS